MNNHFNIGTFNAGNAAVNQGGTIAGDQIGTQNQYTNDPEVQGAIADLQTLLSQLQTQHPHVTTETEALAIIDAEFTEIQQSKTHRLATLRKQLLNPERHLQAIKATLGEVAKHYLERKCLGKSESYLSRQTQRTTQSWRLNQCKSQLICQTISN